MGIFRTAILWSLSICILNKMDIGKILIKFVDDYWEYKWYLLGVIILFAGYIILNHYGIDITEHIPFLS